MGFLAQKLSRSEVPIELICLKVAFNRPSYDLKVSFRPLWLHRRPAMLFRFAKLMPSGGVPPRLNNAIHLAWPKCAVYKKQLFITIIHLRFIYQNAMTLSSPRMNGVATICFFSGLPSAKLMKFVTARQQMKRTVGATP